MKNRLRARQWSRTAFAMAVVFGSLPLARALRTPCTSCAVTRCKSPDGVTDICVPSRTWLVAQSSKTLVLQLFIREPLYGRTARLRITNWREVYHRRPFRFPQG